MLPYDEPSEEEVQERSWIDGEGERPLFCAKKYWHCGTHPKNFPTDPDIPACSWYLSVPDIRFLRGLGISA
jgi:hypothetical protein